MTNAKYTDFDEYIRQGEPDKKEKASIWRIFCCYWKNIEHHLRVEISTKPRRPYKYPTSTQQAPNKYPTSTPQVPHKHPNKHQEKPWDMICKNVKFNVKLFPKFLIKA